MNALLENGGVKLGRIVIAPESGKIMSISNKTVLALVTFMNYLNAIYIANNADELLIKTNAVELELRLLKLDNPYKSGFIKDGFAVYDRQTQERMIFVKCETNFEEL